MASVASTVTAAPNGFVYSVTKAAEIGMTKSVAADYVTRGIRASAICPGTVESPALRDRIRAGGITRRRGQSSWRSSHGPARHAE